MYDIWPGEAPESVYRLALDEQACLHEWHVRAQPERHPLHAVDVAIAASAGASQPKGISRSAASPAGMTKRPIKGTASRFASRP